MKKLIIALFLGLFVLSQGMAYAVPCFVSAKSEVQEMSDKHDCCPDMEVVKSCENLIAADCIDKYADAVLASQISEKNLKQIDVIPIDLEKNFVTDIQVAVYFAQAPPNISALDDIIYQKSQRMRI